MKKPILKIIRKDAEVLKAFLTEEGYTFRFEEIRVDGWKLRTW